MRLYASVLNGKLRVGPITGFPDIAVAPDDAGKAQLVAYFEKLTRDDGWDGHVMNSSSMNFADEDGWPEETARPFLERCIRQAFANLKVRKHAPRRVGVLAIPEAFDTTKRGGR